MQLRLSYQFRHQSLLRPLFVIYLGVYGLFVQMCDLLAFQQIDVTLQAFQITLLPRF